MTCRHGLVHYPGAFNRATRARQLAVSDDSSVLFHPSGSVVQVRAGCAAHSWAQLAELALLACLSLKLSFLYC